MGAIFYPNFWLLLIRSRLLPIRLLLNNFKSYFVKFKSYINQDNVFLNNYIYVYIFLQKASVSMYHFIYYTILWPTQYVPLKSLLQRVGMCALSLLLCITTNSPLKWKEIIVFGQRFFSMFIARQLMSG